MKIRLLESGQDKNGYVYSLEDIIKTLDRKIFGTIGVPENYVGIVSIEDVACTFENFSIENNALECEVQLLDTNNGKMLKHLLNYYNDIEDNTQKFYCCGVGERHVRDGITYIDDYKLLHIAFVEDVELRI